MKRNGFTLIELLAVIVILAIIALIATPIILGIINDAREESNERSVELYVNAIRNGMVTYQLREGKEVSAGAYTSATLPFEVEYDGEVDCTTIELYENGGVYVTGCKVNNLEVDYSYGTKQILKGKMSSVCSPVSVAQEGAYTAGDKYTCEVGEGITQTFYVLTTPAQGATSVNLIMDSNINISGKAVKGTETDLGITEWIWEEDYLKLEVGGTIEEWGEYGNNNKGPITAMNYLQTATAGWTNVNSLTINTFTSCSNATTCTDKTMKEYIVNARMPYLSEISNYDRATGAYAYLYDNLHLICYSDDSWIEEIACSEASEGNKDGLDVEGIEHIEGVWGYWLLSSSASYFNYAWHVYVEIVEEGGHMAYDATYFGVRPVINLSI